MKTITIRRATENDVDSIIRLWRELMDFHRNLEPNHWSMLENAEEISREHYKGILSDPERRVFVAEYDCEIVGYLTAAEEPRPPVFPPPSWGHIGTTIVTHSARRMGVGRKLVDAALAWFKEKGFPIAKVSFAADNPVSSSFWPSLGFRPHTVQAILPIEDN